ncbi:short chain dehydrogenase [Oleiphilus messinensis]|uniref:Short chain dehydrogenase n=1 Tax=Oleiphilus messinensis TaxID=141451 RepID=A0A1Y0I6G7_9GAMM|nr:SDR family oxidoreductase [Oleiphilus messinensis]ARU56021.1 short chain dehydrogenase [Oleiphilus messinensis]
MSTVLILGARSDIGLATAHRFAKAGYDVLLAARNAADLEKDCADIRIRYSVASSVHEFDVLSLETQQVFVDKLPILPDIVVCAVGLMVEQQGLDESCLQAQLVLKTNYLGPVAIFNLFAELFEARGSGLLIGISSVAGDRGRKSNYLYGSAKAGFTAYLSGLRNKLHQSGVGVMTVKPGFVRTAMTKGMKLPGLLTAEPQEVADDIFSAVQKKRDVVYSKWFWFWIMLLIRCIPEFVFKRLSL